MSESQKPNISERFLSLSGLSTLWENIINAITSKITSAKEEIDETIGNINSNIDDIENTINNINNSLNNYRGYPIEQLNNSTTQFEISPNTYYKYIGQYGKDPMFILKDSTNNISNEYVIEMDFTEYAPSVGISNNIMWSDETAPEYKTGKKYIISIINNLAVFGEY